MLLSSENTQLHPTKPEGSPQALGWMDINRGGNRVARTEPLTCLLDLAFSKQGGLGHEDIQDLGGSASLPEQDPGFRS